MVEAFFIVRVIYYSLPVLLMQELPFLSLDVTLFGTRDCTKPGLPQFQLFTEHIYKVFFICCATHSNISLILLNIFPCTYYCTF